MKNCEYQYTVYSHQVYTSGALALHLNRRLSSHPDKQKNTKSL